MKRTLMLLLTCLFVGIGIVTAQTSTVSGIVVSADDGEPVIGASVLVVGTTVGTVTNIDGEFSISNVPSSAKTLRVSFIGMQTLDTPIKPGKIKIMLKANSEVLDEVVVVAYGTANKSSLTGSITVVDSKKIEERITTTVTGALEGSAPGVQVNNTYGEPGASPNIRIRGFNSVNGSNAPLYVVDGVPYDGRIADLNTADIESMSVLKDAASSALFGNRAANGVILITTKKGKEFGKTNITLSTNQGFYTRGIPEYDRLAVEPWMETQWKGLKNYAMTLSSLQYNEADAAAYATSHLISDVIRGNIFNAADDALFDTSGRLIAQKLPGYDDLDWAEGLERTGHRQEYNLSATTSGEKFNVFSSVGYLNEKGYVINTGFERFSGRINSQYNPTKWFKAGINLSATSQTSNYNADADGNWAINPFLATRYKAPVYPIYQHNADGSYVLDDNGNKQYDLTSVYLGNRHIIYELENDYTERRRNTLSGQVFGTLSLPYGFAVTLKGDLNRNTENIKQYNNPNIGDGASNNGRLTMYAYQYSTFNFQQQITWEHNFGLHHVDVLLGHENYGYNSKYDYGMNTSMSVSGNFTMGNFTTNSYLSGYDEEYKTESYLSRARYNYNEKYYGEVSFRRDGSSRFFKDNRWGNFFSVGGSWNITKEAFMQSLSWVDNLKLRLSYGEVGNDAGVNYYGYMALYNLDKNGGSGSLVKKSLVANDIKWETTQTVDVALEGRLFNRLNFSIGYFDKRSKDLLFAVKLPLSAGSYPYDDDNLNLTQNMNIGTISNRGFEISADVDIINNKDWSWNVGADATFLKNEIVKLPDGNDILNGSQRYSEGHSIYEWWTYHFEGVDQLTGNSLFTLDPEKRTLAENAGCLATINGTEYSTRTTYGLRDWRGSALPTVYGSFHTTLGWKGLTLNTLFTYSLGGKTYDSSYASLMGTSATGAGALHKDILNSWSGTPEGITETSPNRIDPNGIPVVNDELSQYNNGGGDRWLTSASYLVLKNITLSYNLPRRLLNTFGIAGVTVNAGIENAFTLTSRKGLNPQYSFNGKQSDTYITARIYNIGLILKF